MTTDTIVRDAAARPVPTPRAIPSPRRVGRISSDEVIPFVASAAAGLALVWVLFNQLTTLHGAVGFVIVWYVVSLVLYWLTTIELHNRQIATDRVISVLMSTAILILLAAIVSMLAWIVYKGAHHLSWHMLYQDQRGVGLLSKPGSGGIGHAILGTVEEVAFGIGLAAPAGIATAVFLNEVGGRFTQTVRIVVTAMAGVPTIVAGIFIYSLWVKAFGFSGLAGALALAVVGIPSITRICEEVLKTVDNSLREASMALGAPAWRTTWRVVLPAAKSGVVTAILLGVARGIGETAPLLLTIFGSNVYNFNLFHGPQEALPQLIYTNIKLPSQQANDLAFTAGLVLVVFVLLLFIAARIVGSETGIRQLFSQYVLRKKS